jgi:hypothetical protein
MMFNSPILDVVFGLVFSFLTVSLASGTILEAVASATKWRSNTLLSGIKTLVNDQSATGLVLELYQHAAISPRDSGTATTVAALKNKPAYIDPKQFANAMLDIINVSSTAPGDVTAMLANLDAKIPAAAPAGGAAAGIHPDAQLNKLLKGIINRAQGDFTRIQTEVGSWFDNGMDRLSGAYKRRTQLLTFIFALVIAGLCNLDSISIARGLWQNPTLISTMKADQSPAAKEALSKLTQYVPIGWTADATKIWTEESPWPKVLVLCGWLLTALSALFGAPFWFDALQSIARLKGTGPSPGEKKSDTSAAA